MTGVKLHQNADLNRESKKIKVMTAVMRQQWLKPLYFTVFPKQNHSETEANIQQYSVGFILHKILKESELNYFFLKIVLIFPH